MRLTYFYWVVLAGALMMASMEATEQLQESRYIKSIAEEVVRKAGAVDNRSRVIALRDYLRGQVTFQGALHDDRPFMRATAAETLHSGKGYCGEVTRAFICLTDAVGIRSRRINLYGSDNHVVAEAELRPGERVLVDGQYPPHINDLEPLDQALLRPEYDNYSTLHLRRLGWLGLNWLAPSVKLKIGPLTYWIENPHALKSGVWLVVALALLIGKFLFTSALSLARKLLARAGWVKVINGGKLEVGHSEVI